MKKNLNIAYLNGAEGITKKVVQGGESGGGSNSGGSGGEASTIEYLDVRDIGYLSDTIIQAALFAKLISDSMSAVAPFGNIYPLASVLNGTITHFAVDWNARIVLKQNDTIKDLTALENILSMGITQEQLDAIPRITKEQFYSLE